MLPEPPRENDDHSRLRRALVFFAVIGTVGSLLGAVIAYTCVAMTSR